MTSKNVLTSPQKSAVSEADKSKQILLPGVFKFDLSSSYSQR
jgi:hypothetical protein